MKRFAKTLGVTCVVAFALTAVTVASASAADMFKASSTGSLTGVAASGSAGEQIFTTGSGEVVCKTAATSGTVTETEATAQKVKVEYGSCKAFGFVSATVSAAEYNLHANGEVDVLNTITINVPLGFCHVTVGPQSGLSSVSYANTPTGSITETSAVGGISFTSSGSLCGSSGTGGTYTGANVVHLGSGPPSSTLEWTM